MRVEAAVEGGEVAAEGEEFVELGEDSSLREDVAAGLAGEFVEGAVVALGDADVGVVDDAHDHVGGAVGGVEAGADVGGECAEVGVGSVLPEVAAVFGGYALAGMDFCGNGIRDGVGEGSHLFIVASVSGWSLLVASSVWELRGLLAIDTNSRSLRWRPPALWSR